jgi:hypothetical protein
MCMAFVPPAACTTALGGLLKSCCEQGDKHKVCTQRCCLAACIWGSCSIACIAVTSGHIARIGGVSSAPPERPEPPPPKPAPPAAAAAAVAAAATPRTAKAKAAAITSTCKATTQARRCSIRAAAATPSSTPQPSPVATVAAARCRSSSSCPNAAVSDSITDALRVGWAIVDHTGVVSDSVTYAI